MATVRDIVERAHKKMGVIGKGESMPADYLSDGVDALNEMLHGWKSMGVDVSHSDLSEADTFPLADEYKEGTIYMLAARLSPEYSLPPMFNPDDWFRALQAGYTTIDTLSAPKMLTRMPSWEDREGNLPLTGY